MTDSRIILRFLTVSLGLLAAGTAAGGMGSGASSAGTLDTQAPLVEILAPSEPVTLHGGEIYDFRWTVEDAFPGWDFGDNQALVLFEGQVFDFMFFEYGDPEFLWSWAVPDTTVANAYLQILALDEFGNMAQATSERILILHSSTPVAPESPLRTALKPAAPNPFNPQTLISFELEAEAEIDLAVYDLQGRRVRRLAAGIRPAGPAEVTWNGNDDGGRKVSGGLYLVRLEFSSPQKSGTLVQKVVMLP